MFDYVRCDYPITPEFVGECQTKDIDGDIGGTMSDYYIDPSGRFWFIDYYGTTEYVINEDAENLFNKWKRVPTGKRGTVRHLHGYTNYFTIYPAQHEGSWETWPEARLHIVEGQVLSFTLKPRGSHNDRRNDCFQPYQGGF
jgi:hypothetical protein